MGSEGRCPLQALLRTWATCLAVEFSGGVSAARLLQLIPARRVKLQRLMFSSAFCRALAWYTLLELEGLLCSVTSFLVVFLSFSFQADTTTSARYLCVVGPNL